MLKVTTKANSLPRISQLKAGTIFRVNGSQYGIVVKIQFFPDITAICLTGKDSWNTDFIPEEIFPEGTTFIFTEK